MSAENPAKRRRVRCTHDGWLLILSNMAGPGSLIVRFNPLVFLQPICRRLRDTREYAKSCRSMHCRRRLLEFSGLSDEIFTYLSDTTVIAGGSVVYALNDFVHRSGVGDLDLFVLNSDKIKTLEDIKHVLQADFTFLDADQMLGGSPHLCFRASPKISGPRIDVCHVDAAEDSPQSIVQCFDLDYVKCFFHRGQFGGTRKAQQQHEQRRVRISGHEYEKIVKWRPQRLWKLLGKGFWMEVEPERDIECFVPL